MERKKTREKNGKKGRLDKNYKYGNFVNTLGGGNVG